MKKIDRIINESINMLLMEVMSLGDVYNTYYSDVDEDIFKEIVSADPTSNDNKMGRYSKWLLGLYIKKRLKLEDLYKATEYLEVFIRYINKIEDNDINHYKSLDDLYNVVKVYIDNPDMATSKSDEERLIKSKEAERVYEDDRWLIIVPLTERAACYYGKGTQWCTTAESSKNYFNHYNNQGRLFINIDKENNRKYQFHFETSQFMNENNNEIDDYRDTIANTIGLSDGAKKYYKSLEGTIKSNKINKIFSYVIHSFTYDNESYVLIKRTEFDEKYHIYIYYECDESFLLSCKTYKNIMVGNYNCITCLRDNGVWDLVSSECGIIELNSEIRPSCEDYNDEFIDGDCGLIKSMDNGFIRFSFVGPYIDGNGDYIKIYSIKESLYEGVYTFKGDYVTNFLVSKKDGTYDLHLECEGRKCYTDIKIVSLGDDLEYLVFEYNGDKFVYLPNESKLLTYDEYLKNNEDRYEVNECKYNKIIITESDLKYMVKKVLKNIIK